MDNKNIIFFNSASSIDLIGGSQRSIDYLILNLHKKFKIFYICWNFKSDKLDDVQKYLLSNDAYSLSNKIFTTLNHHIPGGMFGTITAGSIVGLLISYQGYQGIMSILSSGGSSRKKKRNTHKKKRNTHKKKEIRIKKRNTKKNKKRNRITLRKK